MLGMPLDDFIEMLEAEVLWIGLCLAGIWFLRRWGRDD